MSAARRRRSLGRTVAVVLAGGSLMLTAAAGLGPAVAATGQRSRPQASAGHGAGIWRSLETTMDLLGGVPALWVTSDGHAWDLFARLVAGKQTYEVARLAPDGGVAHGPVDIFSGQHWGSLEAAPALLAHGTEPILVFSGARGSKGAYSLGCVYGALPGAGNWTLQTWTLSADCLNPEPAAAVSRAGVLSAAWPGGWATGSGINYRVGVSSVIPAKSQDQHIEIPHASAARTGLTNNQAGNGHFYISWVRQFSSPASRDGFYIKDIGVGGAPLKAPGTGTNSVNDFPVFASVATASTNTHGGVFMAYCANKMPCHLELWRVGASKALAVPASNNAGGVQIAPGPAGRLWVSWYNTVTNDVMVTRTNKADTRFGSVRAYATQCFEHGLVGLGGGPFARLDIGLECVNNAHLKLQEFVAQVSAGLTLTPGTAHVTNTAAHTVTFRVTDAGDPVKGAVVKVDGKKLKTNSAGRVTVHLAKGSKPGSYPVTASAPNYLTARAKLVVRK